MKLINFNDSELDHLKEYFRIELSIAERDAQGIRNVLAKLKAIKPQKTKAVKPKPAVKVKRKPSITIEDVFAAVKTAKGKSNGKASTGAKRGRKPKRSTT